MDKSTPVCPCRKHSCVRHGDCAACRQHHKENSRYQPACDRKKRGKKADLRP
ncbi:MAG: hypothetical protein ACLRWN_12210 [Eisenbergiella sp.]|uniref:hypothetical protein n=1 Tax=unclassified Eisenbergiella TaxID=2652273 RepID=UPI0015FC278E|nr:hypothetical protein [Eisenbergiella sp. OF01-20]MBS5536884.1 hypothetical protein [Lachnospiraceae bacterium]